MAISISPGELEVMKALWDESPQPITAIVAGVRARNDWDKNTIGTMLERLVRKGAVAREGSRRSYQYRPLVGRDEYRLEAANDFVARLFDGNPASVFALFARRQALSPEDIAELRKTLDELEAGDE